MKRFSTVVLVLCPAFAGCERPTDLKVERSRQTATREDRRPDVGRKELGEDLTEIARKQNVPGSEPKLPSDKGVVSQAYYRPVVRRSKTGFVAELPMARNVPTPAHHGGHIFTGGYGTNEMHALDAKTGKSKWSVHLSDDGPTAPACKDGVCVFNTYSCTIFGLEAETGKHLYSWWLGSPQLATPVIAGDHVYTSYPDGGGPDGAKYVLAAFDFKTGEPKWRRWIDAEVNSTPVAHEGRVFVATHAGTLYEFKASDGNVMAVRHNRVASPPVITAEGLFFGHDAIPQDNDMLVAAHPVFPGFESTGPTTTVKPKPRPLVARHRLIRVEDGAVVATNRKTGEPLWRRQLDDDAVAPVSAPMLYAGHSILLATSSGNVMRMGADTGETLSTFSLGQGAIASQPIAVDGWIYAGTVSGSVVGYDTGDRELTGWEMLGGGPERQGTADMEDS